jgi:hypothetical protein
MSAWHELTVDRSDGVDNRGTRECIRRFWDAVLAAGYPPEVEVWHCRTGARENVFLFSPAAVELARSCGLSAEACASLKPLDHAPDLSGFTRVL